MDGKTSTPPPSYSFHSHSLSYVTSSFFSFNFLPFSPQISHSRFFLLFSPLPIFTPFLPLSIVFSPLSFLSFLFSRTPQLLPTPHFSPFLPLSPIDTCQHEAKNSAADGEPLSTLELLKRSQKETEEVEKKSPQFG